MTFSKQIKTQIAETFRKEDHDAVTEQLLSLELKHVMANSEWNLENARMAVLKLSKGDLTELRNYIACAKVDFRDVIMWAMEDAKSNKK
jgi:hypothetical protein